MKLFKALSAILIFTFVISCGSGEAESIYKNNCKEYKSYESQIMKSLNFAKTLKYPGLEMINTSHIRVIEPKLSLIDKIFGNNKVKEGEFYIETSQDGSTYQKLDSIVFNVSTTPESLTMYIAPYGQIFIDSRNQVSAHYIFNMYRNKPSVEFVHNQAYKDSYGTDKYKREYHTKTIK